MRRQAIEKHNEKLSPHTKDVFTFLKQLEEKKIKKKKKALQAKLHRILGIEQINYVRR